MKPGYTIKLQRLESTKLQSTNGNEDSKSVILVDDEGDGNFTSIQDAIDNATADDTIEVYSGTYAENILINKTLNLYGIDYELGSGDDEGMPMVMKKDTDTIFTVTADGCNISGFDFKRIEYTYDAICVYHSDNNNIFGNSVSSDFGVHLFESYYNNVYDNEFIDCSTAISLVDSEYNKIYENHISDSKGVYLHYHSDHNFVYNNIIVDSIVGISDWQTENNTVFDNVIIGPDGWRQISIGIILNSQDGYGTHWNVYGNHISNYGKGFEIRSRYHKIYRNNISNCNYGIFTDRISYEMPTRCIDIYENNIKNCLDSGIYLKGVWSSNIYRNNITGNRFGMEIWRSERNNIFENNIKHNERIGMWVWYSADNLIYYNNFINPDRNVDLHRDKLPNTWDLGYPSGGNYWDKYEGEDKDGDGIGETPYIIFDNDNIPINDEKDMYPLMEPFGNLRGNSNGPYFSFINHSISFYGFVCGGSPPYTWFWDFGDGFKSDEQNPVHEYSDIGRFTLYLNITDVMGNTSDHVSWVTIQDNNSPPSTPLIDGPRIVRRFNFYDFTFISNDPDENVVWYYIDWCDSRSDWFGWFESGDEVSYDLWWYYCGVQTIRAKTRDGYGAESDWAEFRVFIPRTKASSYWFLERFPMLERLLILIRYF